MQQPQNAVNDNKHIFVPFEEIRRLINSLKPCNPLRLAMELQAATGMRGTEINTTTYEQINRETHIIAIRPHKNQRGLRYSKISRSWLRRYEEYRKRHILRLYAISKPGKTRLFHVTSETFDKKLYMLRPMVGGVWNHKRPSFYKGVWTEQHVIGRAGLRHTYITHATRRKMLLEDLPYTLALHEVMNDMRHHDARMTARYQANMREYGLDHWAKFSMWEILEKPLCQRTIRSYY